MTFIFPTPDTCTVFAYIVLSILKTALENKSLRSILRFQGKGDVWLRTSGEFMIKARFELEDFLTHIVSHYITPSSAWI